MKIYIILPLSQTHQLSSKAVPPATSAQSCGSVELSHPTISNAISRSFFIGLFKNTISKIDD